MHQSWALWEREQGNIDLCVSLHRRGLDLNPTDAALYTSLALVLWRDLGDVEGARSMFAGGVRAVPEDLYSWQAWGYMEGFALVSALGLGLQAGLFAGGCGRHGG